VMSCPSILPLPTCRVPICLQPVIHIVSASLHPPSLGQNGVQRLRKVRIIALEIISRFPKSNTPNPLLRCPSPRNISSLPPAALL
jgi:hypothetical protein